MVIQTSYMCVFEALVKTMVAHYLASGQHSYATYGLIFANNSNTD